MRPPLDPAVAATRLAVRQAVSGDAVVALSGGADSLALLAAAAFERPGRLAAVVVDHGLQDGSDAVAAAAAHAARGLGVDAVVVHAVVGAAGGPEAAARDARYAALVDAARDLDIGTVLTGHTLDDQAETVLLGLARGSGATSLAGMAPRSSLGDDGSGVELVRPFLGIRRATTRAACAAQGLAPWDDPHNADPRFSRVRVRERVLPVLEAELGPGVAEALARTAEQLREDAAAFDALVDETIEDVVEHAEAGIAVSIAALAANPPALRHRVIRRVAAAEFGASLSRTQTLEVARLATDWTGQGPVDLPGCRARRAGPLLVFEARAGAGEARP